MFILLTTIYITHVGPLAQRSCMVTGKTSETKMLFLCNLLPRLQIMELLTHSYSMTSPTIYAWCLNFSYPTPCTITKVFTTTTISLYLSQCTFNFYTIKLFSNSLTLSATPCTIFASSTLFWAFSFNHSLRLNTALSFLFPSSHRPSACNFTTDIRTRSKNVFKPLESEF